MSVKKVDYNGRINIPNELCVRYNLNKDDMVEITDDGEYIKLKKYQPEYVCVVTGKITDKGHKIGNAFISDDGINLILKAVKKRESNN